MKGHSGYHPYCHGWGLLSPRGHHGHGGGRGCHGGGHHGHGWRVLLVHPHGPIDHSCGSSVGHHKHGGHHGRRRGPRDHSGGGLGCHGKKHHRHGGHGQRHCPGHDLDMVVDRNTTPEIVATNGAVPEIGATSGANPEIGATAGEIPSNASLFEAIPIIRRVICIDLVGESVFSPLL